MTARALLAAALVALALWPGPAPAQSPAEVRIDIASGARRIRVLCEPLRASGDRSAGAQSVEADEVLARDLENSAVFTVTRAWVAGQNPFDIQATVGGKWQLRGSQVQLSGEVRDVPAGRPILVREYRGPASAWRALVHRFADDIVLQFTGEPGVSSTRIAFVADKGAEKELVVMDLDGAGLRPLTADRSIVLSPAWSPEGSLLLFTSYRESRQPRIWVVPGEGGRPSLVSGRPGLNTTPSYSPDGREIVCTLTQDGNAEIYRLDARGGAPQRLTSHRAIDTSPAWSPTGREIAFTSDRGGVAQVYLMDREGGSVRRLTYDVSHSDSPAWSPRGDRIAFVSRTGSGFDIWVARADGSGARPMVTGGSNENPRWSPDGRHLVFSSDRGGGRALYVTSLDDRPPRRLDTGGLAAITPAWSPRRETGSADAGVSTTTSTPGGKP